MTDEGNVVHLVQEGMAKLQKAKEERLADPHLRAKLQDWLGGAWPEREIVNLGAFSIPKGGASNEMLDFDVTWRSSGSEAGPEQTEHFVLRFEVNDVPIAPKLDARYPTVAEVEYDVQRALGEYTACPVPPLVGIERSPDVLGRPFYVMAWVPGYVVPTANPGTAGFMVDLTPAQRRRVVDSGLEALAAAHRLDWRAAGLEGLDPTGTGASPELLRRQLEFYRSVSVSYLRGAEHPLLMASLDWLDENPPAEVAPVLTHGDVRIGNLIYAADGEAAAVLDWELAALMPPAMDVAHWLMTDYMVHEVEGAARLEGYPTRSEQVEHYEKHLGAAITDLGYWEIFCAVKIVYVFLRVVRRMQDEGALDERSEVLLYENFAAHYLEQRLGKPDSGLL